MATERETIEAALDACGAPSDSSGETITLNGHAVWGHTKEAIPT